MYEKGYTKKIFISFTLHGKSGTRNAFRASPAPRFMKIPETVIDGYNLLHKLFPSPGKTSLENLRGRMESLLLEYQRNRKCHMSIVYDGGGLRESSAGGSLCVIYTASSKSADAWIIDYVKSLNTNRKMVTIVSSDREVCLYGRAYGAKILSSEEFAAVLENRRKPGTGARRVADRKYGAGFLDSGEVAAWKRLFEGD